MQFKFGKSLFIVIEPTNIRRMKELKPLQIEIPPGITRVGIVATPDMGELRRRIKGPVSPESLAEIMKGCRNLPDVHVYDIIDGSERSK